jgi:hypothetical protein
MFKYHACVVVGWFIFKTKGYVIPPGLSNSLIVGNSGQRMRV